MATYEESFVDIRKAVQSMSEGAADFRLSASLRRVADRIREGDSLYEAFNAEGNLYPPIFVRMTKVGEESGTLAVIYKQLADYFDQQVSMRRRFFMRLIYPAFMVVAMIVVLSLVSAVIAGIASEKSSFDSIETAFFKKAGGNFLKVGLLILGILVVRWVVVGRAITDAIVLFIPGLAGAFRKLMLGRFTLSMHLMTGSAIGLPEAVRESGKASNNAYCAIVTEKAARQIEEGTPLTPALQSTGLFPREFIDIIEVAEESGTVSESLRRVAIRYSEDAEIAMDRIVSATSWGIYLAVMAIMAYNIIVLYAQYVGKIMQLTNEASRY